MTVAVPQPLQILHGGGVALACALDGSLHAEEEHGLFAGDTRVLSTWRVSVEGSPWRLLARTRPGPSTAQWHFENPRVRIPGGELPEGCVHLRVRRRVAGALHDCMEVCLYGVPSARLRLTLLVDADFADVFEVKNRSTPPRLGVRRAVAPDGFVVSWRRADFQRGLQVSLHTPPTRTSFVGSHLLFDLDLEAGRPWRGCLLAAPELDGRVLAFVGDPHADELPPAGGPALDAPGALAPAWKRGVEDLAALRIPGPGGHEIVAAGAPWFMALFGRDPLVAGLMSGVAGVDTRGALLELAALQAHADDPFRDAEPGKLPHELRVGELAHFRLVPHSPYYGTHDAPALFVLALWNTWRWTGDRALVDALLPAAVAALDWCRRAPDGILAYRTRSPVGYRNQAWKDAGDAIVHLDGHHASLPIATVELQGYWFAAERAMAELLDAMGDAAGAARARAEAEAIRARVEARFWMEEAGCYALALDGEGRRVESIASNPGHLLWCGLPSPDRARRVAARLLAPDMSSGWGLRTLSSAHVAYNPLSYQLGSVWPHDTALFAAGLYRYGLYEAGARVLSAVLDAAAAFEDQRLPELFCGFAREEGPPVPYARANAPQAWAAAAPILAVQLLLGLVPDAPNARCALHPRLPDWLPSLDLRGVRVGGGTLDVRVEGGEIARLDARGLEVRVEPADAPLWSTVPDRGAR